MTIIKENPPKKRKEPSETQLDEPLNVMDEFEREMARILITASRSPKEEVMGKLILGLRVSLLIVLLLVPLAVLSKEKLENPIKRNNLTELQQKQVEFTDNVALLLQFAKEKGYKITFGDTYRDPRCGYGSPRSKHRQRLAIDLNLFIDNEYVADTESHLPLGEFWESLGGIWGGRFRKLDGNHYEWKE